MDWIGVSVGAILTLLVFSYLLGDTPLFRIAQAIFVGVAIGYAATIAINLVLWNRLFEPLTRDLGANWHLFVPLVLGVLLFAKLRADWAPLGNLSVAFLFGVGSALAIGGALRGALVPQLLATLVPLTSFDNVLVFVGTIGALLSFRFVQPSPNQRSTRALDGLARAWGAIGRWFVLAAFGAMFADIAVSRISILVSRMYYLLHDWLQIIQ